MTAVVPARANRMPVGHWPRRICLGLSVVLMACLGLWIAQAWLTERSLARARELMKLDRLSEARAWLVAGPVSWGRNPEAAYHLGVCEQAAGNIDAALAAWASVDSRSPWFARAGVARARALLNDLGRFADGERLLVELLKQPGSDRDQIHQLLARLYFWEGRRDAIRRMIEQNWSAAADPILELRAHWRADQSPVLLENVRREVDRASRLAADDDRVWLAQANLATQSGKFDEARDALERCTGRRPDDPVVWTARLDWARAADNLAEVKEALVHLPAAQLTEEDRLSLRAWLSARIGNREAERRALEQLVTIAPDSASMERLALLAWDAGDAHGASEYRHRKAELDAAKDRYRLSLNDTVTSDRLIELAGLAESLGRRFEARGWYTLLARSAPADRSAAEALSRLGQHANSAAISSGVTLADEFADLELNPMTVANRQPVEALKTNETVPLFRDLAHKSGLRFTFDNGRTALRQLPETTAGGIGLLDFDGDGLLDVYAVQGGVFPPDFHRANSGDRLFRNQGDGTFTDVTDQTGIGGMKGGYGHGVAVGDIDNDGHPDLFITRWRSYALYRNRGDGTFVDITEKAGLGGDRDWPTSAAWADFDNDGDLDLYVCHYLAWDAEHPKLCDAKTPSAEVARNEPSPRFSYCTPQLFPALADHLFRNDSGRFVDVTDDSGIVDHHGRGLGVVAADIDADGLIDLFVANDATANYLWHNLGGMKFQEAGVSSGVACNAAGAFQAGMGVACGDLDGDLRPDLFVTNFYGESTTFFRNLGSAIFGDQTAAIGLAGPSRFLLGFGIALLDADNDGRLDLATANGHVNDDRPDTPYAMPAQLMLGGQGRLTDVTRSAGEPWTIPRVGRGLAVGDLDNDGRIDVVIVDQQAPLAYFHNETARGHYVSFLLEGIKSNRDGVGAVITVKAGGRACRGWRLGGGSFLSASDPRVHFGLGQDRVDDVEVRWPSGQIDHFGRVEVDRCYRLREGATKVISEPK